MVRKTLTNESFVGLLSEVSLEISKLLESDHFNIQQKNAFAIVFNTMRAQVADTFGYLPPAERDRIMALAVTWEDFGLLFGKAPQAIVDILLKNNAKVEIGLVDGEIRSLELHEDEEHVDED